jgi:hypothetical protein
MRVCKGCVFTSILQDAPLSRIDIAAACLMPASRAKPFDLSSLAPVSKRNMSIAQIRKSMAAYGADWRGVESLEWTPAGSMLPASCQG